METRRADDSKQAHIRPLRPDDLKALSAFLRASFETSPDGRFASPELLTWKYLQVPESSAEPRSFVMIAGGRIVAHAGLLRVKVPGVGGSTMRAGSVIDWAADRAMPGAGVAMYRHAMEQSDVTFLIGGARATQSITAKLGFRSLFNARVYMRWVRPVREFLRKPKSARAFMRLLHGIVHSPWAPLAGRREWSAEVVAGFDHTVSGLLAAAQPHACGKRTIDALNHRLHCPTRSMRGYLLRRRGAPAGMAIASIGASEARILDVRLLHPQADSWSAAFAIVTEALSTEPRVCRISALSSAPIVQHALEANRYWLRGAEQVLFHDPQGRVPAMLPLDLPFFDSDIDYYSA